MKVITKVLVTFLVAGLLLTWLGVYLWPEALEVLDPVAARVTVTLCLLAVPLVLVGAYYGYGYWRKRRQHQQVSEEQQYLEREKKRILEDWKQLQVQLQQHFKQRSGALSPYGLPWLVILGEESSGKSSWLLQAGFAQVQPAGEQTVHPRCVTFWISEHAVVLELGSQFLKESYQELDAQLLSYIYSLLQQYRPRQPLTGLLVACAIRQILLPLDSVQEQARRLRRRLLGLDSATGVKLPIWLQVTCCDQLEGFVNCFNQSCSPDHSIPLGMSMEGGYQPDQWQTCYQGFHQSLARYMTDLLHSEKSAQGRLAIGRFLFQVTLLQERIKAFLEEIYGNPHHAPQACLAGVWLSSAQQKGDTYDLLASELSSSWGFTGAAPRPQSLGNTSYFIRGFFPRVGLPVLAQVQENPVAHRWWQGKLLVASLAIVTVTGGATWMFWKNIQFSRQGQLDTHRELSLYQAEVAGLSRTPEVEDLISPLVRLQRLVELHNQPQPFYLKIGLLGQRAYRQLESIYQNQLQQRLFLSVSEQVQDTLLAYLYLGHKREIFHHLLYYLMLFDPSTRNREGMNVYLIDLLNDLGELTDGTEDYLVSLLNDLWKIPSVPIDIDQALVNQARDDLGQRIDNQLLYGYIRSIPAYSGKVDIRNKLGSNFSYIFRFKPGYDGYYLPFIFTLEGYKKLDLTPDSHLVREAVDSLGKVRAGEKSTTLADRTRISSKLNELYYLDYIRTWKTLISNIELKPSEKLSTQLAFLQQFYQGDHPALFELMASISDQTQLEQADEEDTLSDAEQMLAKKVERKVAGKLKVKGANRKIIKSIGSSLLAKLEKQRTSAIVNEAFSAYATFYTDKGVVLTENLELLYAELQQIAHHPDTDRALYDSAVKLANADSMTLPILLQWASKERTGASAWLEQLCQQLLQEWMAGAGRYVQRRWRETVYASWQAHLVNRFPFASDGREEVKISDFSAFLRPGGELDQFVSHYLDPFVVQEGLGLEKHWYLRSIHSTRLSLSDDLLKQLDQAERVQNHYFSIEGDLGLAYRVRARQLSSTVTSFNLRDGNGHFSYSHGPLRWQSRRWPQGEEDSLSLNFASNELQLARKNYSGSWAWQRFLADGRLTYHESQLYLTYKLKEHEVSLELDTGRTNPFERTLLTQFKLPATILQAGNDKRETKP